MDFDLEIGGVVLGAIGTLSGLAGVVVSIWATRSSNRNAREANKAAKRSADAAERSAALAEEEARRHDVTWSLVHLDKMKYELINQSIRDTAYHVRIEHSGVHQERNQVEFEEVGPGSSIPLFILKTMATNPMERLVVTWFPDREKSGDERKAELAVP